MNFSEKKNITNTCNVKKTFVPFGFYFTFHFFLTLPKETVAQIINSSVKVLYKRKKKLDFAVN